MKKQENISKKKQKQIDEYLKQPLTIKDKILIDEKYITDYNHKKGEKKLYDIRSLDGDDIVVSESGYSTKYKLKLSEIEYKKWTSHIGANPFFERFRNLQSINYSLSSIMFTLGLLKDSKRDEYKTNSGVPIKRVNWNPIIIGNDNNVQFYQRDFVWTVEQNQRLIESIYKGISCGLILVRMRSWAELEKLVDIGVDHKHIAWCDIVDGKQRLNAIKGFLNEEYPDLHGNYYSDLSKHAQYKLLEHQLFQFAEMKEESTDEEVLYQFMKVNHEGVPQSKEHLDFVSSLLDKLS